MEEKEQTLLELLPEKQRKRWRTKGIRYVNKGITSFTDLPTREQKMMINYLLRSEDLRGILYKNHNEIKWSVLFNHDTSKLILDLRSMVLEAAYDFTESIIKIGKEELKKLH